MDSSLLSVYHSRFSRPPFAPCPFAFPVRDFVSNGERNGILRVGYPNLPDDKTHVIDGWGRRTREKKTTDAIKRRLNSYNHLSNSDFLHFLFVNVDGFENVGQVSRSVLYWNIYAFF